jgi:hypothetical protein
MPVCNCLFIEVPDSYIPERRYVLDVVFKEFLGLDIHVRYTSQSGAINIRHGNKVLSIVDTFFATPNRLWLSPGSLPEQPLKSWNLEDSLIDSGLIVESCIPVIFGDSPEAPDFLQVSEDRISLGLDVFGSTFFMLTRYEEVVKPDLDNHGRFPAHASLSYQEGFIDRPIVNEYLEILWWCLKNLFPTLSRKDRQYRLVLTHDVDQVFELKPFNFKYFIRRLYGDVFIRRNKDIALLIKNMALALVGKSFNDRFDTFDWIMSHSESLGVRSEFYFIAGHSPSDPRYDIHSDYVRAVIRNILSRGHLIGLHPSYETYLNPEKLLLEANVLREILSEEGYPDYPIRGRQHYLRWKAGKTWQDWEDAGLSGDSSVGLLSVWDSDVGLVMNFRYLILNCGNR